MFILLSFGIILFTIICLLNFRLGALLVILFLPLYLVRFNVFGAPTNILDILIFILFIVWVFYFVIPAKAGIQSAWQRIKKTGLVLPIFLILAGSFLSMILNANKLKSLGLLKSWFIAPIIFFVILISFFNTERQRELVLSVLAVSGAGVASPSLVYKILGIVTYDGRLQGIFNSPNYLAMYLAPCILICGYKIAKAYESHSELAKNPGNLCNNEILRWPLRMTSLLFFILIITLTAFSFTFSYSAWISLFIALIVFFGLFIRRYGVSKKTTFLIYGGFIAILALGLFSQLKSSKMADLVYSKRYSVESRLMIWRSAGLILKENPLWGIGLGNFQEEYLALAGSFEKPYLQWAVPHPHNIFLAFWLSCGLLGLAGFIWLLVLIIKKGLALFKTNLLLTILFFSILTYILLHGLVDTTYFKNDLAVMFWIILLWFA